MGTPDMTPSQMMAEQAASSVHPAAAGLAGQKMLMLGLPVVATLIAWWLGMRLVPPKTTQETVNRLLSCAVASFVVGLPVLVLLRRHAPWVFASALELAQAAQLDPIVGFFAVIGCVLLLCSLPGPWIIVAYVKWFSGRKGKDLGQMAGDLADDVRRVVVPLHPKGPEQ
jgi:hypothetical protein